MKSSKKWLVAAALSVSISIPTIAFAQTSGGGSGKGNSNGPGGAENGAMSSPNQPGAGMAAPTPHTSKSHKTSMHSHKKPATDTTNMPGADASSDTKGQ
ncbi:hypothetical protein LJ655_10430 [Paraburkholderia sp. MMS20-SJTN17]|uniref:Uncharacterized protein n=1 Tax=Paraburkholderia translucens TaxID=2886945 RepID=A0ABS8KC17_9BURK|nr:hypothetical protein [Paraburkholderia sp. MMS20-SJTN17]MCC8402303.1 hypothetical protein [Paraburkholderia sp. MMS20-SJTN17]